jgi:hypothetical protein
MDIQDIWDICHFFCQKYKFLYGLWLLQLTKLLWYKLCILSQVIVYSIVQIHDMVQKHSIVEHKQVHKNNLCSYKHITIMKTMQTTLMRHLLHWFLRLIHSKRRCWEYCRSPCHHPSKVQSTTHRRIGSYHARHESTRYNWPISPSVQQQNPHPTFNLQVDIIIYIVSHILVRVYIETDDLVNVWNQYS